MLCFSYESRITVLEKWNWYDICRFGRSVTVLVDLYFGLKPFSNYIQDFR